VSQSKLDAMIGAAMAFLIAFLVLMFLGIMSSVANAGTVCRQQVVAHQYAAPLVAPVYYKIGAGLQQEAADTQQFRHSEEYIELQQLRGFKAGVDAVTASGLRTPGPPQPATGHPAATEEGQTTETPAAPGTIDVAFASRYPTLAVKCSKCHTGDTPKGDVFLDGSVPLDGPDAASKRDAIARAIVNERMPDGKPLGDQEQFNALVELFTEPVSGE
jgi:hypothetical protein